MITIDARLARGKTRPEQGATMACRSLEHCNRLFQTEAGMREGLQAAQSLHGYLLGEGGGPDQGNFGYVPVTNSSLEIPHVYLNSCYASDEMLLPSSGRLCSPY